MKIRFGKRRARSHRKATVRGWNVVFRRPRAPEGGHESGPLPLPRTASMRQRTVELPKLPPRTAYIPSPAEARAAAQHVVAAAAPQRSFESQFRLQDGVPLFRDEAAVLEYEDRYQARLRQLQRIPHTWSDGQGVNLGSDQSPKTITWSTRDYRQFADEQAPKQVSR